MKLGAMALILMYSGAAMAQSGGAAAAGEAHIRFTVENPKTEPVAYSLVVYESGKGSYTASAVDGAESQTAEQPIQVKDALVAELFKVARGEHFFAMECDDTHGHVAFTGKKTLAYAGPDGTGSCTFNYSREQAVNEAADKLMDVAYTLSEGARLRSEHLHDRLALDAELEELQDAAKEHRALEIQNIAPELESIANDEAVMKRAQARARELLSEAGRAR